MFLKNWLWYFAVLFVFFCATAAKAQTSIQVIPMPAKIGGTVTVDSIQLTQSTAAGYTFVVTKQDGTTHYVPAAEDTDGLNTSDWYGINIPIYDATDQPGGANPGDTAIIHVYKNGSELTVTSPGNGQFTVGAEGSITSMDLEAVSTQTTHTVTFTAGADGTLTGTTTQTVNDGDDCTAVTAVPDAGYQFTGWTGDHIGTDNPLTVTNVTSDMNIAANFAIIGTHTVTFTAGSGGTLTGTTTQTVNDGDDCTAVTAVPDAGYQFTGWTGDYTGTDNPLTITNVTSNMNITANFAVIVVGGPADGATLSSDKGTFAATPTSIPAPAGAPANFIYGLLDFTILGLNPGDTVTVEVTMPGNVPAQSIYYKYQGGQFSQYNNVTGLNDGDATFILTITDGGPGDEDGVANGIIIDAGGPGVLGGGPATVPTLNEWGMIILVGSFFILGLYILRRRGTHCAGA
jgi:uncharacterized repeat protein (TIGR02543 family)